jgi:transcriptional regulator with XRE-family HTH domain
VQPADEELKRPGGLAERLYSMRRAAGLASGDLARRLGWPASKVSKLQNGQQMPTVADITAWAAICGQPEAATPLLDLLAQAEAVHWQWRHRLRRGHAALQQDLDQEIRQARQVRVVEVAVIPGLLQTPAYARRVLAMSARLNQTSMDEVEPAVAARIRRQEALYDLAREFEFVMTESILRRRVGGPHVMAAQLDRLIALSGLANITLGVIPDDAELGIIPGECFMIIDGKAVLETWTAEDRLGTEESAVYARVADTLLADAATGEDARRLINATAAHWRRTEAADRLPA